MDESTWNGSMVQRKSNGPWCLYPYLMPETIDADGTVARHGQYVIAYSRDGWWLLDNHHGRIIRWFPSEQEAIKHREKFIHA